MTALRRLLLVLLVVGGLAAWGTSAVGAPRSVQAEEAGQCYRNSVDGMEDAEAKYGGHLKGAHVLTITVYDPVVDTLAHYSCDPYGNRTIKAAMYIADDRGILHRASKVVTEASATNAAVDHTARFVMTTLYRCLPGRRFRYAELRITMIPNYPGQPNKQRADDFSATSLAWGYREC